MLTKIIIISAFTASLLPSFAQQKTIVGKWSSNQDYCKISAVNIGPLSLETDDIECKFDSVSRKGNAVEWNGKCQRFLISPQFFAEKVVAVEQNNRLKLTFEKSVNLNAMSSLERCSK